MIISPFLQETQKRAYSKRKCVIAGFQFEQFLYVLLEKSNKLLQVVEHKKRGDRLESQTDFGCGQKPALGLDLTLSVGRQRINEIVEILVAIFFIWLNINCFRLWFSESLEKRRNQKKSGDRKTMLLLLGPKGKKS